MQKSEAARTVAANNIVNAGCMTLGALATMGITNAGVSAADQLLMAAGMCLIAAWLAWVLHKACDHPFERIATQGASAGEGLPPAGGMGH